VKQSSRWLGLLTPLSILYSLMARIRTWCYARGIFRKRTLPGTIISVGNLTVGGTGKTPMVLAIAERLAGEGKRTAILTRGYRGTIDSKMGNEAASGDPQSDEVALLRERLAGRVQLGVGADRHKNGAVLARHGISWFVLDDGFQHLKLRRDADVVLVDATDPFGGGRVLPAGRLREPVSALGRADIVVITRSVRAPSPAIEAIIKRHTDSPIFYSDTCIECVLRIPRLDVSLPAQDYQRARFLAFCGIGNPSGFYEDLRNWGFHVVRERSFPDHHVYAAREADALEQEAVACGVDALLCTEKDVWNLRNVQFMKIPAYCCRISLGLPEDFWIALAGVLRNSKSGETP
jgi:tetraacyldisaccharide 4'-kinase